MKFKNLLVNLGLVVGNAAAKWEPSGIAGHLLDAYGKKHDKAQLRLELEALLRAGFGNFREELADAMGELRLQLAEGSRAQVEAYLSQFQASARQASRCLGDPTATTVPATVGVHDPAQLAAFLPQEKPRFAIGDPVPGLPEWKLIEPLGSGGFGEVWKAQTVVRRVGKIRYVRESAFKFFLAPVDRQRFSKVEAAALTEIHTKTRTDGVVNLLATGPDQDPPWIQLELIRGGDLSRLPEKWKRLTPRKRVKTVRTIIRVLVAIVARFHALGVVHRDLKPSNILLREVTDHTSLVVADFGISKVLPAVSTATVLPRATLGTIQSFTAVYASPQQKRGASPDRRDDVYALGVLWYQLICGDLSLERPSGDGWKTALAKMGASAAEIALLNRCWDDDPEIRPEDGVEFSVLLRNLAGPPPAEAAIDEPEEPPLPPVRPRPRPVNRGKSLDNPRPHRRETKQDRFERGAFNSMNAWHACAVVLGLMAAVIFVAVAIAAVRIPTSPPKPRVTPTPTYDAPLVNQRQP